MAFCRRCDLRVLVAIVCGLLTTIVFGMSIWRIMMRIKRGTYAPPSSIPIAFCRNGGTWENGRCICTEEWKGLRCTMENFCKNSTYQNFTFPRIPVGRYGSSLQKCNEKTLNAGHPIATRLCNLNENGEITLEEAIIGSCNENLESLEKQIDKISVASQNISTEALILTSDVSKLTPENITSAANVVGQIFNSSRNASSEAKLVAVTTVSNLLDVNEDVFQEASADNTFATLIEQMEAYSLSLGNKTVVEPNIAIQSVNFSSESTVQPTGIRFTVRKGTSNSLISGSTSVSTSADSLDPDAQTELQIWLNTSKINLQSCGFVVYQNNKLFQSKTFTTKTNFSQKIISGTINKNEKNQSPSVEMVFRPQYKSKEFQLHSYACVYWNFSMKDWDTNGCYKERSTNELLRCRCTHTTNFAVLMTFKEGYTYPESLDTLSNIGCALSIIGLVLTIIFQIVTRKVRKTSITWVLVSLCISMLIFNLLFVFGIENSNKNDNNISNVSSTPNIIPHDDLDSNPNPTCTAIAILLHYFLLATFTWTGLSAAQLYFLLIRTMKPLPQRFIMFISLIGWGLPAVVVSMTVGIIFSHNKNDSRWYLKYRKEEICWLAIPKNNDYITSPLLWSFILPVTIILLSNVIIFIIIVVQVLWKNNQNLTSTKKVSLIKKILSTLSIAVIFGITWILAYLMLIGDDVIRTVFSYMFCSFNTTQGLQIFILYTVRTKTFQNEASKVLKSLSSSSGRLKSLPPMTPLRLRVRMYNMLRSLPVLNERFRLLEPLVVTQETTLSESDQANADN
ncbi:adhesion G-protein coupled receptor G7 [Rousettus aegyptiacus]|uniref:Adhesion G-protein coupled receptor G7 n=1 Tax=Rousettus aegyptiacus TaxID=9407 RepID=A0A7J8HL97_ROUAE|nr:adhesion G-protein coupled receptor G7 [Rousettus aegyptiacus]KAF6473096.1 adhesion G protein-coupled receptor G7 [Rousettus aegyptiacus]